MDRIVLKLYVAGQSLIARRAETELRLLCEALFPGQYDLTVIDVQMYPDLAEEARILATPTLVKEQPEPARRVIGDLRDRSGVLRGLELPTSEELGSPPPAPASGSAFSHGRTVESSRWTANPGRDVRAVKVRTVSWKPRQGK